MDDLLKDHEEKIKAAQKRLDDLIAERQKNDAEIKAKQEENFDKWVKQGTESRARSQAAMHLRPEGHGHATGSVTKDERDLIRNAVAGERLANDEKYRQQEWQKFDVPIAKAKDELAALQQERARLEDIAARPKIARMEAELQARQHQKDREGQGNTVGRYEKLKEMGAQSEPARELAAEVKQAPPQTLQAELAHERVTEQKAAVERAADQQKLEEIRQKMREAAREVTGRQR